MEFGFVPAQIVKDLEELGNWKVCIGPHACQLPQQHNTLIVILAAFSIRSMDII